MIDIVIPVHNEEKNIKKLFDNLERNVLSDFRINIVYDFKNDNTLKVIEKIRKNYSFSIRSIKNIRKGPAWAVRTGFLKSDAEYVLVLMADLSDDTSTIDIMVEKIGKGYDIVCPSRYCKNGKQFGGGVLKTALSKYAGLSLRYITGVKLYDWTNNFRLYRKSFLDSISLESIHGFEIGIELLYKAYIYNNRLEEIPCVWKDRLKGDSGFRLFRWLPFYMKWYSKILYSAILKRFF